MRPFWPLAALCLLLHLTTACKEIKLKFDLQRMVERELNKIPNNLSWSCLVPRHGEEDLCRHPAHHKGDGNQHHPRAWREGESGFGHLDLVIGLTKSFPIYENIIQWVQRDGQCQRSLFSNLDIV